MFDDEITDTDFRAGDRDRDLGIGRDGSVGVVEPDQNGKRITDIDVVRGRKRCELGPALGNDRDEVVERDVFLAPSGALDRELPSAGTVDPIREGNPKECPGHAEIGDDARRGGVNAGAIGRLDP